jgi:hypothetical protein
MKTFISILITVGVLVLLPISAFACSSRYIDVSGVVSYSNHHVGKGVVVTVICRGDTLTAKTNRHGEYSVQFNNRQCKINSRVTVGATYDGATGSVTRKVKKCNNEINVVIVPVSEVPEFGAMASIGATIIGGGSFLYIRRRNLSVKKA